MTKANGKARTRKPKQVDLEEAIADANEPRELDADEAEQEAAAGHNSALTDDERRALTYHHKTIFERTLEAKKQAAKEHKGARDIAKAELGANAIADIEDLIALDTTVGEAAHKAEIERSLKVARWSGLPVGTQTAFFDDVDRTPDVDRAREAGKIAAMRGQPCTPPHDPSVPQHQTWMEGWHVGHAALVSAFSKKILPCQDDMPPVAELARADTSDVPFAAGEDEARTVENPN